MGRQGMVRDWVCRSRGVSDGVRGWCWCGRWEWAYGGIDGVIGVIGVIGEVRVDISIVCFIFLVGREKRYSL